jgi:hypothetical protein
MVEANGHPVSADLGDDAVVESPPPVKKADALARAETEHVEGVVRFFGGKVDVEGLDDSGFRRVGAVARRSSRVGAIQKASRIPLQMIRLLLHERSSTLRQAAPR